MKRIAVILVFMLALVQPVKAESNLSVSAKAAVLINGENGEVVFAKNSDQKMPMASTTKIMTALLLCEYGNFEKEITVTAEMLRVEGSSMGLLAGDKVTLHDLLYGLMLASGNDAANVIAFTVGGSIKGFVDMMNNKARELELVSTHFETPSGLDGDSHCTTAYELAMLTKYAMQNEEFSKAVSSKSATLNYGNPPYRRTLTNHNKLLKMYDGVVGVKTGFTKKSGRCLVSAAKRDGKFLIAVTLNAPSDWQDHKAMLDYGFTAIKQTNFSPLVNGYNIPVINGSSDGLFVEIEPLTINSLDTADIDCKIYLPQFLYAPVKTNEEVGKAVYMQGDKILTEKPILSKGDITSLNTTENALDSILKIFKTIIMNI
ncbi:MAG: D-alanyl-D-alanine carboxypeptidase [Clostridia bacterium]|nr:D-alanyl-D-alanine carboxypeptidase [Clostridia bacterium]